MRLNQFIIPFVLSACLAMHNVQCAAAESATTVALLVGKATNIRLLKDLSREEDSTIILQERYELTLESIEVIHGEFPDVSSVVLQVDSRGTERLVSGKITVLVEARAARQFTVLFWRPLQQMACIPNEVLTERPISKEFQFTLPIGSAGEMYKCSQFH